MIVVTGPNGNVGQELIKLLRDDSALEFRIAARDPRKIARLYGPDLACEQFDYADRATWPAVLEGVSVLFLLFPLPHPRTAKTWMVPFVEAAVAAGARHIVYVSVPGADQYRVIPHHTVEQAIIDSGVDYTFLRAAYFSQNLIRDISTHGEDIRQHDEIFIPARRGLTSFVDSRDVATVAHKVLRDPAAHRNQAYVLTGPEALGFDAIAKMLSEELQRPIRYADPAMPRFWWRMWRRGMPWDVLGFMSIVYFLTRFGKNAPLTDTLPGLLGRPATPMRQFIRDYRERWISGAQRKDEHPLLGSASG